MERRRYDGYYAPVPYYSVLEFLEMAPLLHHGVFFHDMRYCVCGRVDDDCDWGISVGVK